MPNVEALPMLLSDAQLDELQQISNLLRAFAAAQRYLEKVVRVKKKLKKTFKKKKIICFSFFYRFKHCNVHELCKSVYHLLAAPQA